MNMTHMYYICLVTLCSICFVNMSFEIHLSLYGFLYVDCIYCIYFFTSLWDPSCWEPNLVATRKPQVSQANSLYSKIFAQVKPKNKVLTL